MRDAMLDTMEVNELPIGNMTVDLRWPWTVLVQGH